MKSLISLWSITAKELAVRCCTSATRDITTVASRTEHEGLSFLAITLASLGKATQGWLDRGFVDPSEAPAFGRKLHTSLPAFLSGFYGRVFDPVTGVLLDNPDIEAIYALRQLTLMFSKIALPDDPSDGDRHSQNGRKVVSEKRERLAMSEFVQCEQDVRSSDELLDPLYLEEFGQVSEMLFGSIFTQVDREIYWDRIYPKHGPGATADRLFANAKWDQQIWTERLQRVFPAETYLFSNRANYLAREFDPIILEPGSELPVRVITVPKTLKAPRVIAIEPTCMQYMQQGIGRALSDAIRDDGFISRIVGLTDQEPNRVLARKGSFSGELATLDLSEASDRVSNQHVIAMLQDYPHLLAAVQATRSTKADVPGHGVLSLAKFASMGSALCFPMEAMVFTTIIFLAISKELGTSLDRETCERFRSQVRVFGDDIIVPREYVHTVVEFLETFGFRVNLDKSFWTGRFRESCGREYYDGFDVSIVKVRSVLPKRRADANGVISAVSFRNLAYWSGLWQTARWMDEYLEDLLKVFPNVAPTSPLLGRESALGYQFEKLDPYLHSPLTKGWLKKAKSPPSHLEGTGALLKCLRMRPFSERGLPREVDTHSVDDPVVDDEHLERSGRPKRVSIKLGWSSPY